MIDRLLGLLQQLALLAFMVAVLVALPPHIQQQIAPEPGPAQARDRKQSQPSPAPIWSRSCTEKGRTMIAHQADGGPWRVQCHGKAVRT